MSSSNTKSPLSQVECPNCGKLQAWDTRNRWRPFCSERCKMVDLGDWFEEQHRIPGRPDLTSEE